MKASSVHRDIVGFFRVFDITLGSSIPLPELQSVPETGSPLLFRLAQLRKPIDVAGNWLMHWQLPDSQPWLSVARYRSGFLIRFPDIADFTTDSASKEIECSPSAEVPESTIRHLLLDHVLPFVMSTQGNIVLHGGAVSGQAGAIVFLGKSGYGKSTLCGYMSQRGFPILSDDCLLLRTSGSKFQVIPAYGGVRLYPETFKALFRERFQTEPVAHYTDKLRVALDPPAAVHAPDPPALWRIYALNAPECPSEKVSIAGVSSADTFLELLRHSFRLEISEPQSLRMEFERLAQVASVPILSRLSYPRDLSLLDSVCEAILSDLRTKASFQ